VAIVSNIGEGKTLTTVVANPIFLLSPHENLTTGGTVTFEVLEKNADGLRALIGQTKLYVIDGSRLWATLRELIACTSTHSGLNIMRHKPTLRGVLAVIEEPAYKN
jgi:hypothetical protein